MAALARRRSVELANMTNKYNQWKHKNLTHNDESELLEIRNAIHDLEFLVGDILTNWFFQIDMSYNDYTWPTKEMPNIKANHVTHRPDIIVMAHDEDEGIKYIVELDGSVHTDGGPGARRTAKRNKHYSDADIPFHIIDKEYCKLSGLSHVDVLKLLLTDQPLPPLKFKPRLEFKR